MFKKMRNDPARHITVWIGTMPVDAEDGEPVASVILRQDTVSTRTSVVSGAARAPYCMMGVCFDCLAVVDGIPSTQTCQLPARNGMRIERQVGARRLTP
jgi:D-hydroxyproline dehydrogenase subunit gamma